MKTWIVQSTRDFHRYKEFKTKREALADIEWFRKTFGEAAASRLEITVKITTDGKKRPRRRITKL